MIFSERYASYLYQHSVKVYAEDDKDDDDEDEVDKEEEEEDDEVLIMKHKTFF